MSGAVSTWMGDRPLGNREWQLSSRSSSEHDATLRLSDETLNRGLVCVRTQEHHART
jgi:hypothetical protein